MIRINLIAQKVSPNEKKGRQNLVIGIVFVLLALGGCYYHFNFMMDFSDIEKNNKIKQQYISQLSVLRNKLSKIKVISADKKKEIQENYKKKLRTVTRIEKIRSNPVFALLELSKILSTGQFPTISKKNARARLELDLNWDPSLIYISQIKELGRDVVLSGVARSYYDISELAKRLKASSYFRKPEILESKVMDTKNKKVTTNHIQFKIQAVMVY